MSHLSGLHPDSPLEMPNKPQLLQPVMSEQGSTSSQKSLFFNMRRVQAQLEREAQQAGENLDKHQLNQLIATEVGVPLNDVEMMDGRLSGSDFSLNATQAIDEEGREWIETLEDENARADLAVEEDYDQQRLADWLGVAMNVVECASTITSSRPFV